MAPAGSHAEGRPIRVVTGPALLPRLEETSSCMERLDRLGWGAGIIFRSHGLRIGVRVDHPTILDDIIPLLPPDAVSDGQRTVSRLYSIISAAGDERRHITRYRLLYANIFRAARSREAAEILETFESDLHLHIGEHAPERIFVHAGVVASKDRALLLPGRSLAGKSTLVAALLRAGAVYYSDEFAVLDRTGRVHPFPRPLGLRAGDGGTLRRLEPGDFGAAVGERPLPVGAVAVTSYREGSDWSPRPLSSGTAVLRLLEHTVPARGRPGESIRTLRSAVSGARLLEGVRGEAEEVASELLALTA